ncbi:phosphatase 2C-like domain-containing protein, partial [Cladochytrium replicatum]
AIVDKMDCNSVGSNDPCEDFTMHHKFGNTLLIGVFDGHGGTECGKTISQYLGHYLAHSLSILPAPPHPDAPASDHRTRRDKVTQAIRSAFTRLDDDLLKGGLDLYPSAPHNKPAPPALPWSSPHPRITEPEFAERMRAAVAGSCAIVAYVEGRELYVACTGDSRGVVGMRRADGTMEAVEMSRDQTVRNPGEYARMVEEHPGEGETVFVRGRVLGGLMPTRAFGDARYKWPRGVQSAVLPLIGKRGMPRNFYTPPYVTAAPEIVHRTLSPGRDKFLILATDGLWDVLESDDAVDAVARLPGGANAATELVRCALGDGDSGDVVKMGRVLGIPPPQSRRYRDDVTVRVLWFEGEDG